MRSAPTDTTSPTMRFTGYRPPSSSGVTHSMMMYSSLRVPDRLSIFLVATFVLLCSVGEGRRPALPATSGPGMVEYGLRPAQEDHMRFRLALALFAVVSVTAFTRSPVARQQSTFSVREYVLPHAGAFAHDPAVGPDGIVWF